MSRLCAAGIPTPTPAATARPVPETRVVRLPAAPMEPVHVPVAPHTEAVRIEVPVPDIRRPSYRAAILDAGGTVVWKEPRLVPTASDQPLVMTIPTAVLVAHGYSLEIHGERLRGEGPAPRDASLRYTLRIQRQSP